MAFMPGWNSIETIGHAAHWLHISAIVVLGLLVVAEALALIYDNRREDLIAEAERVATIQRRQTEEKTNKSHQAETGALQKQLSQATDKVEKLERDQAPRQLSEEQKKVIIAAISPYPGQDVDLVSVMGDAEAYKYAMDFDEIFKAVKWNVQGGGISQAVYTGGVVVGVTVSISKDHGERDTAPTGAGHLMMALIQLGIIKEGFSDQSIVGDNVQVRIGRKVIPP